MMSIVADCVPDDHSRVILEPVSLEPSSDYINANFLDVSSIYFCCRKRYLSFKSGCIQQLTVARFISSLCQSD